MTIVKPYFENLNQSHIGEEVLIYVTFHDGRRLWENHGGRIYCIESDGMIVVTFPGGSMLRLDRDKVKLVK